MGCRAEADRLVDVLHVGEKMRCRAGVDVLVGGLHRWAR